MFSLQVHASENAFIHQSWMFLSIFLRKNSNLTKLFSLLSLQGPGLPRLSAFPVYSEHWEGVNRVPLLDTPLFPQLTFFSGLFYWVWDITNPVTWDLLSSDPWLGSKWFRMQKHLIWYWLLFFWHVKMFAIPSPRHYLRPFIALRIIA